MKLQYFNKICSEVVYAGNMDRIESNKMFVYIEHLFHKINSSSEVAPMSSRLIHSHV